VAGCSGVWPPVDTAALLLQKSIPLENLVDPALPEMHPRRVADTAS
jgi:hypothetical protein